MATFSLIVYKEDQNKGEYLVQKGKLHKVNIDECDFYMEIKYGKETTIYVWPTHWGYSGKKDGYCMMINSSDIDYIISKAMKLSFDIRSNLIQLCSNLKVNDETPEYIKYDIESAYVSPNND